MRVNKYRPHILVLAEDQANIDIVNGFLLHPSCDSRAIDVRRPAGGWSHVRDEFAAVHVAGMRRWPKRRMIPLIDCDQQDGRLSAVREVIPNDIEDRVFVIGAWSDPERLRAALGCSRFEELGERLATECREGARDTWNHELLRHNADEVARMARQLRPILFEA
jgi:hypothetical protein